MSVAPVLQPRLEPPPAREGTVARSALAERLSPSAQATVGTLVAPAGYGKTTLLAEVAASRDLPVAWLTVNETDNEPAVFRRRAAIAAGWALGLDEPPSTPARLRRALRAGPPIRIVLDDLQALENDQCLEAVQALASHLPPRAQLLLASRAPIAFDRRERLVELGAGDLRMSAGEAALLLRGAGVNPPDEVVAALTARLEGWPTGLYLAALAHRVEGQDLSSFGGADRYVRDYFREECLAGLDQKDVRFLERASVLERLTARLCDRTLQTRGSAERLERLSRATAFVIPLGEGAYRLHQAFREMLQAELRKAAPETPKVITARATEWCVEQGDMETAARYAWSAGRPDRYAELTEQAAAGLYHSGGLDALERLLAEPGEQLVPCHPELAAWGAIVHALRGRADDAVRLVEIGEETPAGTRPARLAAVRSALCQGGAAQMATDAAAALEGPARPAALLLLGVARLLAGESAGAQTLADASAEAMLAGNTDTACLALAERAGLAVLDGNWDDVERLVDEARTAIREAGLEDYPTSALTYATSAHAAVHASDWVRARADAGHAARSLPVLTDALPWLAVQVRLELAQVHAALSDHETAAAMLAGAEAILGATDGLGVLHDRADRLRQELADATRSREAPAQLTPAEQRLLPLLTTYLSFREIAESLDVSRNTVKTQAICVYRKLGVSSRSAAIDRASELGLVARPEVLEHL
jgi:LuxR family transcriptional regulator, maltose regulon positive regulatory protein